VDVCVEHDGVECQDVDSFQTGEQHALALLPDLEEFGGNASIILSIFCASPGSLKYPKNFGGPSQNPGLSAPPLSCTLPAPPAILCTF